MVLLSFLVAAAWVTTSLSAVLFPGPRTTTTDGSGHQYVESSIWDGEDATKHYVTDYGDLRPTVVYNCHWMIALCQNARDYLGTGNGPWTFHYDRAEYRNGARRASVCPNNWADDNCANGPTLDWYTEHDNGVKRYPPMQYCVKTPKRHGYHKPGQMNADNTPKLFQAGVISSCDEFPPASWIEGGVQGGNGARAICAPIGWAKSAKGANGQIRRLVVAWRTEQNWQGDAFRGVGTWLTSNAPDDRLSKDNDDSMFSVFAIRFKMINDPASDHAAWVEAGADSKKRYCYGPKGAKCSPDRTPAEETIIEGVNRAMLDLEDELTPSSGSQKRGFNVTVGYRAARKGLTMAGMVMVGS